MRDALTIVVIPALIGILATLLTIFLTPSLQHYFWRRQRRAELQIATINGIVQATSEFASKYVLGVQGTSKEAFTELIRSLHVANAQVRALFSLDTALAYAKLLAMLRPTFGQELVEGRVSLGEFLETRNAALHALYVEAGVIPRDRDMPRVLQHAINSHREARLEKAEKSHTSPREPPKRPEGSTEKDG